MHVNQPLTSYQMVHGKSVIKGNYSNCIRRIVTKTTSVLFEPKAYNIFSVNSIVYEKVNAITTVNVLKYTQWLYHES